MKPSAFVLKLYFCFDNDKFKNSPAIDDNNYCVIIRVPGVLVE